MTDILITCPEYGTTSAVTETLAAQLTENTTKLREAQAAELDLRRDKAALEHRFAQDVIRPVAKGVRGANLIHEVRNGSGHACASEDYRLSGAASRPRRRGAAAASAAAMRVCQPGPLAFQRASVSGGMRRLIDTFASGDFGRPRGFNRRSAASFPMSFGNTSAAGRARLKSAAVHSGFSSSINSGLGLRFFITPYLSVIGLAQADDVNPARAGRKHQHVQSVIDQAQCLKALFAIVPARVFLDQGAKPIEIHRPRERESTQGDIPRILGGIETDVHGFNVYAYIRKCKPEFGRAGVCHKLARSVERTGNDDNRGWEEMR